MKSNEIMTADVKVIRPGTSIKSAAEEMRNLGVGALPVCDGEKLVGMLTDRDITIRAVAEGRDPGKTTAGDCMSPEMVYCFEDDDLERAQQLMKENQVRRLPVISREKKLVGILAIGDLATKTERQERKVGETLQEISEPPAR
jgi:CBS domain-containing protein